MDPITVAKQFIFHAAHRLPNHKGPCRELHGHTYKLEVMVTGRVNSVSGASDEGMVFDFADLKAIYREYIEPLVEHKYLNETLDRFKTEVILGERANVVPAFPLTGDEPLTTCEVLATWMKDIFKAVLCNSGSQLVGPRVCVRLWETPTSYAEAGKAPWRG